MLSALSCRCLNHKYGVLNKSKYFTTILCRHNTKGPNDGGFAFNTLRTRVSPRNYILLIIPIATFGLGTWQIQRRKWKLNLIKSLEEKTRTPPIEFPWDLDELKNLEYCRVRVRGTFNHDQELYISPRSRVDKGDTVEGGGLMSSSASTGSWIITPFTITDRNMTILVNRGWVPKKMTSAQTRQEGQIEDEVDLTGVVRLPERRMPFMPKHNDNKCVFSLEGC
uniref:SURF1-like protein n=1 Tax=Strigamia maritima TaxID=126957 RepID=T1JHR0_STRMM